MKLLLSGVALVLASSAMSGAAAQSVGKQAPIITTPTAPTVSVPKAEPSNSSDNAIKPSSKAMKAIAELQAAVNAKDTANIPAKLAAAKAVAQTKEDRYWIARLELNAAANSNNVQAAAGAIDTIAATGLMSQAELGSLYGALAGSEFSAKQYDAAAAAFQHQLALDPNNTSAMVNLALSQANAGHKAEAVSALQRAIKASTAAGTKPDERLYRQAVSLAYEAKLPSAIDLSEAWASAYPSADSWRNTVAIFRNTLQQDAEGTLDLMRLMQAAGAMQKPSDYAIFAQAALDQQNYTEAQAVIDAGIAAHVVDPSAADFQQLLGDLKSRKKMTAADLDAALKMSPSPTNLLRIGDRFYAMGDYAKAAQIYRDTIGKRGLDAGVSNLHLGMALLRSGDKAGAIAAFKAVKGTRADIAELWLIYAQQHA